MNPRRLFVASCIALVASAFSFVIRQDIMPAQGRTFDLTQAARGTIAGAAFLGMALSMFFGAPLCDVVGMKRMLGMAFVCHLAGVLLTVGAPYLVGDNNSLAFYLLWFATLLVGSANGFVEIGINPLAATLYPTRKTHMLNVLHAWWPGGLMIGGLLASLVVNPVLNLDQAGLASSKEATTYAWQVKTALVLIPTLIYGALFVTQRFPVTERVASGISSREMYAQALRPMFLLWAFCMLLTAATELGPQQWQNSVLTKTANMSGTHILIYTSLLMFLLRHFAGPIAHKLSPVGMLTVSAALSAVGLYSLSYATDRESAFATATVYGLGIVFFWPTMLGVTAERFAKGGSFLLGLMGCVGNLSVAVVLPIMGQIYDNQTLAAVPPELQPRVMVNGRLDPDKLWQFPRRMVDRVQAEGAQWAFRYVSALPVLLVVIFGGIALADRARGGYKPEELSPGKIDEARLASDF
jgi:MFS family permease